MIASSYQLCVTGNMSLATPGTAKAHHLSLEGKQGEWGSQSLGPFPSFILSAAVFAAAARAIAPRASPLLTGGMPPRPQAQGVARAGTKPLCPVECTCARG